MSDPMSAPGAKGFRKAIQDVFGAHGIVQRCQWHKRENVVDYLRTDRVTSCNLTIALFSDMVVTLWPVPSA
jgi:hypothetical protein